MVMPLSLSLRAHAKLNLSLRVLGVRPDGYHDLETVFQSLALHDTLDFEMREGPLALTCTSESVPLDARNLVWQAAAVVWACSGRRGEPEGVRVHLRKRIPVQGGLGGGSSDAAAALLGFARLWAPGLEESGLAEAAVRLGADVAFFLCGGTALGLARGDRIFPLADLEARHVVLVCPPFGVSTPEAYGWLDADRAAGTAPAMPSGTLPLPGGVSLPVVNDLEPAVARRHPEIGQLRDSLRECGAEAAAMSGSGSTVFALFTGRERAAAAAAGLRRDGWRALLTRTAGRRQSSLGPRSLSGRGPLV